MIFCFTSGVMWILLLLTSLFAAANAAVSINSQNYLVIDSGFKLCYRRLNATHTVGCGSDLGGNVGAVFKMTTQSDATRFREMGGSDPYVLLMSMSLFADPELMSAFNRDPRVKGVVLMEAQTAAERPKQFSVDARCPNAKRSYYGAQKQCAKEWNAPGNDYFFTNWNFPIVLLTAAQNDSLTRILKCHEQFNTGNSDDDRRCALEVKTPMFAVANSRVCLRRSVLNTLIIMMTKFCDVMAGYNYFYLAAPKVKDADRNTIVVVARTDALSMFTDLGYGSYAVYPAVSVVIALAEAFSKLEKLPKKRILFALLDAESMQNMGSARLVYDMQQKRFLKDNLGAALELRHVHSVIEIGQLGSGAASAKFHVHTAASSKTKTDDDAWAKQLKAGGEKFGVSLAPTSGPTLPPASAQTFLKGNDKIAALLISDFTQKYENNFYHSMFDDEKKVDAAKLANLTRAIFWAIFSNIGYPEPYSDDMSNSRVVEIANCFYNISGCELLQEAYWANRRQVENDTLLPDASLRSKNQWNRTGFFSQMLLLYLTGRSFPNMTSAAACRDYKDKDYPKQAYTWINGPVRNGSASGVCWSSLVAKLITDAPNSEDYLAKWDTERFAFWTESVWDSPRIRLFLAPSRAWEIMVLLVGICLTLFTIGAVLLVDKNAANIFPEVFAANSS